MLIIPPLAGLTVGAISRLQLLAEGTAHGTADNFCTSATLNYRVARECSGIWKSRIPSAAPACRIPFGSRPEEIHSRGIDLPGVID